VSHSPACLCKVPGQIGPDETCVCPAVSALVDDAYQRGFREGYNAHARAAQHWQDTHGAYRATLKPSCPWCSPGGES
jgi:hypothetical protein